MAEARCGKGIQERPQGTAEARDPPEPLAAVGFFLHTFFFFALLSPVDISQLVKEFQLRPGTCSGGEGKWVPGEALWLRQGRQKPQAGRTVLHSQLITSEGIPSC